MKCLHKHMTFERALAALKMGGVAIKLPSWDWKDRIYLVNGFMQHAFDEHEFVSIRGGELLSNRWEVWEND